jgi:hypothetical protein
MVSISSPKAKQGGYFSIEAARRSRSREAGAEATFQILEFSSLGIFASELIVSNRFLAIAVGRAAVPAMDVSELTEWRAQRPAPLFYFRISLRICAAEGLPEKISIF